MLIDTSHLRLSTGNDFIESMKSLNFIKNDEGILGYLNNKLVAKITIQEGSIIYSVIDHNFKVKDVTGDDSYKLVYEITGIYLNDPVAIWIKDLYAILRSIDKYQSDEPVEDDYLIEYISTILSDLLGDHKYNSKYVREALGI